MPLSPPRCGSNSRLRRDQLLRRAVAPLAVSLAFPSRLERMRIPLELVEELHDAAFVALLDRRSVLSERVLDLWDREDRRECSTCRARRASHAARSRPARLRGPPSSRRSRSACKSTPRGSDREGWRAWSQRRGVILARHDHVRVRRLHPLSQPFECLRRASRRVFLVHLVEQRSPARLDRRGRPRARVLGTGW